MTIFTDGIHVISDRNLKELHDWARTTGVKRGWFSEHPRHPHYDLPKRFRRERDGTVLGATDVTSRDLVRILRGHAFKAGPQDEGEEEDLRGRRLRSRTCGYCGHVLKKGEAGKYLYPDPRSPAKDDRRLIEGKSACPACAPALAAEQYASGIVIPVQRRQV